MTWSMKYMGVWPNTSQVGERVLGETHRSWDVVPGKPRLCHAVGTKQQLYLLSLWKWQDSASRVWG